MEDHDVMPLLQLARVGDQVRLVDGFVPPVVSIDASDFLLRLLRDTRDEMLGRCRQLEEYKSPKGMQAEDLDAQFLMMMQAVQVLNRQVPALTHLIETRGIHPWLVYGQLRQCVGELSTFSQRVDLLGRMAGKEESLPAYHHEAPALCFVRACDVLLQILSEIAAGPELMVTLVWRDGWLQADIPQQYLVSRHRFYLIIQSDDWSAFDVQAFLSSARLAATAQMADLIDHALPGIELMPLSGPPQGLPRRSNARYFRIEQVSEGWAAVQPQSAVSLDWPEAPEGMRAVIAAIRG
jgi:type VI secretion system protein ImpJ